MLSRPNPDSYVVPDTSLAAGAFPGSPPGTSRGDSDPKLRQFLDSGISAFIDLTDPVDGLTDYAPRLRTLASEQSADVTYDRMTIRDMDVCDAAYMRNLLDLIDARLAEGRGVYVHCWGGIGRTGTVIGCWLVRRGHSGEEALARVMDLFSTMAPDRVARHRRTGSPQTSAQRAMVREWAGQDKP